MQKRPPKQDRVLSPGAFDTLLNWLDEGTDSSGQAYLEMRRRLVAYFDRRNCAAPEELADETLNRVTRRIEVEGNIISDMGRGASLRQEQLEMIKLNPKLHPFYWANFIQSREWANLDGKR